MFYQVGEVIYYEATTTTANSTDTVWVSTNPSVKPKRRSCKAARSNQDPGRCPRCRQPWDDHQVNPLGVMVCR